MEPAVWPRYRQHAPVLIAIDEGAHDAETRLCRVQKVKADFQKLEHGGWIGRGADAFFPEMHGTVLPASQRLETALKTGSQVTKEITQHVRNAEEEASSPFRQTS